jgi:hypothetical protein
MSPTVFRFCFALFAAQFALTGPVVAQFPKDSNTIVKRSWSETEISAETERHMIRVETADDGAYFIISGFFEVAATWIEFESTDQDEANLATERRDELREYLLSLPRVQDSMLAEKVHLIQVERDGDWLCATGYGCYPKGYVVGLGPVSTDRDEDACQIFRNNDWFCAPIVD